MISLLNPWRWVKVSHLRTALACSSPGRCWSSPRRIVYGAPASLVWARTLRGAPLRSHSCCTFGELACRPSFLVLRLTLATELICWTYVMWLILNFTTVSCSSAGLCQTRMEMSSQPSNFLSRARDRRCAWSCLVSNSFFGAFPEQTDELPELPQIPQRITWTSAIKSWSFTKTAGLRMLMKQRDGVWKSVGTLLVRCKPGNLSEPWTEGNVARSVLSPIETLKFVVLQGLTSLPQGYHINMKMAMSSKKDMDRIDGQIASHGHTSAGTGFASCAVMVT